MTIADIDALLVDAAEEPDREHMLRQLPPEDWALVEEAGGRPHTTVTRHDKPVSRTYFANRDALLKLRDAIDSRDGDGSEEEPAVTPATLPDVARSPGRELRSTDALPATDNEASSEDRSPEDPPGRPPDFDRGQNLVIEEIGRVAGILMKQPVLPLGDSLPADPDQAHERCHDLVWKLHRAGCLVGLYAGQVFSLIEDRELWKGRAESFVDYLRSDEFNPLGYDTTRRLQRVYRAFCEKRRLRPEEIHTVEVKKLDAIVAHERQLRKAGQEISNEEVLELTEEARELTRADFQARLREIRGEEPMRIGTIEKMLLSYQSLDGQSRMEFKRGMASIDSGKKRLEKEAGWVDVE